MIPSTKPILPLPRSPIGPFRLASPHTLRSSLLAAALAAAAGPTSADTVIDVLAFANAGGIGDEADNAGNITPPGGAIHGVAEATRESATAFVANGGAGPCDFFAGAGCAYTLPQSRAMGEVRGDLGRLRAAVYTSTDVSAGLGLSGGEVNLWLGDIFETTLLGDLRFDLHFDVDNVLSGIESTLNENVFQLHFLLQPLIRDAEPTTFEFTMPEFEGGHTVIDRSFVLAALPASTRVLMKLEIFIRNECGINNFEPGGSSASIWTDAGNTAYIGVQGNYVSSSGYAYPGFVAPAPALTIQSHPGYVVLEWPVDARTWKLEAAETLHQTIWETQESFLADGVNRATNQTEMKERFYRLK